MKILLSPAKSMKSKLPDFDFNETNPLFLHKTKQIISSLSQWTIMDFKAKMKINDTISLSTFDAFQALKKDGISKGIPSIYYYDGLAFKGLSAIEMNKDDIAYAQESLFILSGLYGLLRPLDLIHFYRLEMAFRFKIENGINSLYDFWSNDITNYLNKNFSNDLIVNLASNEYSRVINTTSLLSKFITCHFLEVKNGAEKVIASHAKKARGLMAKFIISNQLKSKEEIKLFDLEGYTFRKDLSNENNIYFSRVNQ